MHQSLFSVFQNTCHTYSGYMLFLGVKAETAVTNVTQSSLQSYSLCGESDAASDGLACALHCALRHRDGQIPFPGQEAQLHAQLCIQLQGKMEHYAARLSTIGGRAPSQPNIFLICLCNTLILWSNCDHWPSGVI